MEQTRKKWNRKLVSSLVPFYKDGRTPRSLVDVSTASLAGYASLGASMTNWERNYLTKGGGCPKKKRNSVYKVRHG
jgi:hypothetical protein